MSAVLVDPHPLFRSGLRHVLESDGVAVLGEEGTAEAGLELVERYAPDVAIVDPQLPDACGIATIRRMSGGDRGTQVLALAGSAAAADVVAVVLGGGSCLLLKDQPVETIVAGVRAAAAGDAMIAPQLAGTLLHRLRASAPPRSSAPVARLSQRERDVLRLVAAGRDNDEIAGELFISPHTVKNHVSSILAKLGVANRIQAAVWAVREALV